MKIVLQKRVHAVERPTGPAAGDGDQVVADDDPQAFLPHGSGVEAYRAARQGLTRADEDVPVGSVGGRDLRELNPCRLGEDGSKLVGGVGLAGRCVWRHHDVPAGELGQIDPRPLGGSRSRRESQQRHDANQRWTEHRLAPFV
jgi:hypothetical protein